MKNLIFLVLVLFVSRSLAQDKITTFILVRHAEKDLKQSTNDPDLSAEGKKRAIRLASYLKETEVSAIYSTAFKRTRQTIEPLAAAKSLSILEYAGNKEEDIDAMIQKFPGGTIVVSGHSNTIPWFANKLFGVEKYRPFEDDDYDNLWIVTVFEKGKSGKLVWLNY
jgi:broad specificity phosphatase PhoE